MHDTALYGYWLWGIPWLWSSVAALWYSTLVSGHTNKDIVVTLILSAIPVVNIATTFLLLILLSIELWKKWKISEWLDQPFPPDRGN